MGVFLTISWRSITIYWYRHFQQNVVGLRRPPWRKREVVEWWFGSSLCEWVSVTLDDRDDDDWDEASMKLWEQTWRCRILGDQPLLQCCIVFDYSFSNFPVLLQVLGGPYVGLISVSLTVWFVVRKPQRHHQNGGNWKSFPKTSTTSIAHQPFELFCSL